MWKEPVLKFQEFHLNQFSPESKEYCCHTLLKNLSFFFFSHNLIAKIFLINWTWISHFTKDNKDTNHTNGIHIHTPEGRTVTILQDDRYGVPNKHFPNTNGPRRQTHVRTNWQNTQQQFVLTNGPRRQTHVRTNWQNAQQRFVLTNGPPRQTHVRTNWQNAQQRFVLKRQVSPGNTGGLTRSWSSSACPDACFRSTNEKRMLTASAEQGRNREDPPNTWFLQLLGASPQSPL